MRNHQGHTLAELICGMVIIGIAMAAFAAPVRTARDVAAVRAARADLAAAAARTRSLAVAHGGAELRIDTRAGTVRIVSRDSAVDETLNLAAEFGVAVTFRNTQALSAVLRYDALGIGRVTSRTVALTRGGVEGGITFS